MMEVDEGVVGVMGGGWRDRPEVAVDDRDGN